MIIIIIYVATYQKKSYIIVRKHSRLHTKGLNNLTEDIILRNIKGPELLIFLHFV